MKYEFEVYQMKVEDHLFWVAKSKILKGCVGQVKQPPKLSMN